MTNILNQHINRFNISQAIYERNEVLLMSDIRQQAAELVARIFNSPVQPVSRTQAINEIIALISQTVSSYVIGADETLAKSSDIFTEAAATTLNLRYIGRNDLRAEQRKGLERLLERETSE